MSGVTLLRMHELNFSLTLRRQTTHIAPANSASISSPLLHVLRCNSPGRGLLLNHCLCSPSWIFVTTWEGWSIMGEKIRIYAQNGRGTSTRVPKRV